MRRMSIAVALAGVAALSIGAGSLGAFPVVATAAAEPAADVSVPPAQAAWQHQWELLLRREEQLRRDEEQVQQIAPRLSPNVVDQLEQGLALTRQRLTQRRHELTQQQPPGDPAANLTVEPVAVSPPAPGSAVAAWPGS